MTSYKDILAEAPQFFEAYQSGYTLKKRAGALNLSYLSGICTRKLTANAHNVNDSGYTPIYPNAAPRGIINYGTNILIDPYRNMITALLQNLPNYEVYPAKDDDDKKIIADVATTALKYHDEKIFNLRAKVGELFTWAVGAAGTAYLALQPEDTGIKYQVAGTENDKAIVSGDVAVDEFGKKVDAKISSKSQKRLQIYVKSIGDVACSEDSTDGLMDSCTIQIECIPVTLRDLRVWVKKETIEKIAKRLPKKTAPIENEFKRYVREARGEEASKMLEILTDDDRQIKIYKVYHKADSEFKNGWYGITDEKGEELYFANTLPIPGIMPFTQINTNNLGAGEYIKQSVFDDARGPQVLYQGLFDSRATNAMLAARPPRQRIKGVKTSSDNKQGVGIYPKQGDDEVIEFEEPWRTAVMQNPNLALTLKARFMEVPQLNSDVATMLQECKEIVLNVTGQNLANVGSFPNNNISGASVQEQVSVDQMGQLPLIALCNDFWYRFRVKTLKAIRAIYPTEQLAYMLNDDTISKAEKFKIEDIDDSYDIRVISTDGLPATPMGKIDFYTKIMQMAPTPDEAMDAWNKIKELVAGYGLIDNDQSIEEKLAEIENKMILEDESLIADMQKMVPAVDSIGNPLLDTMGQPMMEPLAKQRVQKWANRFQNEVHHIKEHRPLVVGPEMLRNGAEKTQLAAWHIERHEETYAIKNKPPEPPAIEGEGNEQELQ